MFPHNITLFNVYKIDNRVYYHKTYLTDVFFYKSNIVNVEGKGLVSASQYHCIIPKEVLDNYIEKKEFDKLPDKTDKFTFSSKDIVVKGFCEDITNISELQASTYEYFMIKTINDNLYGKEDLQSIEVTN